MTCRLFHAAHMLALSFGQAFVLGLDGFVLHFGLLPRLMCSWAYRMKCKLLSLPRPDSPPQSGARRGKSPASLSKFPETEARVQFYSDPTTLPVWIPP